MSKIVVLSCTNRPDSNTLKVSKIYLKMLQEKNIEAELFDFCELPKDIAFSETFGRRTKSFSALIERHISQNHKFIFIVPEYNGSFPGILKTFLDSVPPREWWDKDACLVGIADGRAGNLRGMEHLTGIMNYLRMHVYHDKLPISVINKVMDDKGNFSREQQETSLRQLEGFLKF